MAPRLGRIAARSLACLKRIGILTAGGDTPALNSTIHGAVVRANQLNVEIFGLIKGSAGAARPPESAPPGDPRA